MKTDALLLDQQLRMTLGTRELPFPAPGEALVRVAWAGVCGSDLHVLKTGAWVAYWPATLGHEVVGVVQDCPGGEMAPGTTVVLDSRLPCGACPGCAVAPSLCHQMTWMGEARPGGFARHLVVPVRSLVRCPPDLEPAIAVLAEPLAVAMHAVSRLAHRPHDALVLGYGPIGALVHLELVRRWPGLPVFVSEPAAERRRLGLALGASPAPGPSGPEGGGDGGARGFSLVVDAAGYPGSLTDACAGTANGGTVLVVALSAEAVSLVPAQLAERALTIVGSIGFDGELEEALVVLAADADRYRPLVSEAVLLEEAAERLAALGRSPSAGKVVVRPWQE
ncbi:MAG: alcohol dehydrogenase catalytic domain-containing protein [Acidimicrobiales bacterium]